jgi:hypothetical protein
LERALATKAAALRLKIKERIAGKAPAVRCIVRASNAAL